MANDLYAYLQYIQLYEETFILAENWKEANRLTKDVDSDDITFVALALQIGAVLWTGDKKLAGHLKSMGFNQVVSTAELSELLNME